MTMRRSFAGRAVAPALPQAFRDGTQRLAALEVETGPALEALP